MFAGHDADGRVVGYAIPAQGMGYQDRIGLIYGLDVTERRLLGLAVLESRETPGLGGLIADDPALHRSLRGIDLTFGAEGHPQPLALADRAARNPDGSTASPAPRYRAAPSRASFVLVIASFVTVTDLVIEAIDLELHRALGAFVPLIVVNCLILGRMEAYASRHSPAVAAVDALAMGAGFALALLALGAVRELLGQGSLFGVDVFGAEFEPWVIMLLPGGGFFALAALVLGYRALDVRRRAPHG